MAWRRTLDCGTKNRGKMEFRQDSRATAIRILERTRALVQICRNKILESRLGRAFGRHSIPQNAYRHRQKILSRLDYRTQHALKPVKRTGSRLKNRRTNWRRTHEGLERQGLSFRLGKTYSSCRLH